MIKLSRIVSAILLAAGAIQAQNPTYDPHWFVGQNFQVRFDFQLTVNPKVPDGTAEEPESETYTYTVTSTGSNVATISVVPTDPQWPQWLLTFDTSALALLKVEQVNASGNSDYSNPFGADAWLTKLGEFTFTLIHDYGRIPANGMNELRTISTTGSSTPPFTQQVTFDPSSVTAVLSRTDAKTGQVQQATIRWVSSRPVWWTSAEIRLGSTVQVTGTLLP
jgi:hypothetical protein